MPLTPTNACKAIRVVKGDRKCTFVPEPVWETANFCGNDEEKQSRFSRLVKKAEVTAVIDFNNL